MTLSPATRRAIQRFKNHRLGYVSALIFVAIFGLSMAADLIANDRPLIVMYQDNLYWPILHDYAETEFGGEFYTRAEFHDPFLIAKINANGWMLWPLIPYHYDTLVPILTEGAPAPPSAQNWLGTDDLGRDVLARTIHGLRLSIGFGLLLSLCTAIVGIIVGSLQGYFGGWVDLLGQRLIEIWSGLPTLFIVMILASIVTPNFLWLLALMVLFGWTALVGLVRAEFLRVRQFDFVKAAVALGVDDLTIIFRHILPNALVSTLAYLPFMVSGAIASLASLDFLGFGLPVGSPSLGELLSQGKNNLSAPWLSVTSFLVLAVVLSLLIFAGEALRQALNPKNSRLMAGTQS